MIVNSLKIIKNDYIIKSVNFKVHKQENEVKIKLLNILSENIKNCKNFKKHNFYR